MFTQRIVDLKYLTPSQIVDVVYEGHSRRFAVEAVSASKNTSGDDLAVLASDLDQLSLESKPRLWTVGWDTFVTIVNNADKPQTVETASFEPNSTHAVVLNLCSLLQKESTQVCHLMRTTLLVVLTSKLLRFGTSSRSL